MNKQSVGQTPNLSQGATDPAGANTPAPGDSRPLVGGDTHSAAHTAAPWPTQGKLASDDKPTAEQNEAFRKLLDESPWEREERKREKERQEKFMENYAKGKQAELEIAKIKTGRSIPPGVVKPENVILEIAMNSSKTTELHYLFDPFLPRKQVVGFFGRGATAKSSFLATLAARVSDHACTLWISTEEVIDWITVRHIKCGADEATLFAVKAIVTATDDDGRAIATDFNIYSHLEPAIRQASSTADGIHISSRPLRLVVLDTAVALTTWGKGESANDDGGVKRLMSFLKGLAEKYDLTIAVIGHSNKGKHDQLTDMVAGSAAWTNSPRQAFIHLRDQRGKDCFVIVAAKHSLTGPFAAEYMTEPVHILTTRPDGNNSVLCQAQLSPAKWGYDAVQEIVNAALGKEDDREEADEPRSSSKQQGIAEIVAAIRKLLTEGYERIDRGMVTEAIGRPLNKRHLIAADEELVAAGDVITTRGQSGAIFYELKK